MIKFPLLLLLLLLDEFIVNIEKKIGFVESMDKEKELETDDGDTKDDKEDKAHNDSDTGSGEGKCDQNNVDISYEAGKKYVQIVCLDGGRNFGKF